MDRQEMASFLRERRGRIDPQTAGFTIQSRRRVPGLRREEVAELADISPDWYTRLEQGRDIGVSGAVLMRLSKALQLSRAESRHLFTLAGLPLPELSNEQEEHMASDVGTGAREALLKALEPNPAYYITGPWDLVSWNRAAARIVPELTAPEVGGNIMRMIFCNPDFRARLVDWEAHARHCLAIFRGDYGRNVGEDRFRRLAAELTVNSAEFAQWWPQHQVDTRFPTQKRLRDEELGELDFVMEFFHAAEFSDLILVVFVGDESAQQRIAAVLDAEGQ